MLRKFGTLWALALVLAPQATEAAIQLTPAFENDYAFASLGTPNGVPGSLGGLTLLDNDTLLIGGNANAASGAIYQIDLTRDSGGHITGFAGAATLFATAPNIDGGLAFGPGGVLFFTRFPTSAIGQIKPGSAVPDRSDGIFPTQFGNVGTLAFVPAGFAGAGQLKVASYNGGANFGTMNLTADGNGTFNLGVMTDNPFVSIGGGPEGIAYVKGSNPVFGADSVLISEYSNNAVATYQIDANGDPIVSTRRLFITGLTGAEGAFIDPVTGDFLFSTFGGGNQVVVVKGFQAPPGVVPEAGSVAVWAGLALVTGVMALLRQGQA